MSKNLSLFDRRSQQVIYLEARTESNSKTVKEKKPNCTKIAWKEPERPWKIPISNQGIASTPVETGKDADVHYYLMFYMGMGMAMESLIAPLNILNFLH